jgi:peroxiredoxin
MGGVDIGQFVLWGAILLICWFCYHLFLQNGRLQLRLEALEKELEAHGILSDSGASLPTGLPIGSVLHDFALPGLTGGTVTLSQWRGKKVLLIFFNPDCVYCLQMVPSLSDLAADSSDRDPVPLIISTGDVEENRRIFAESGISDSVVVQEGSEAATLYRVPGTPMGYLVDERGQTATNLLSGAGDLLAILGVNAKDGAATKGESSSNGQAHSGFSRSLANSKIMRDGLSAGTRAPDFTLPRVDGGELSLKEYLGAKVLLVFSDPACQPCQQLAPKLEKIHRRKDARVLMISRGDAEANRQKIAEHGLTFPVVLQRHWEISRAFGVFATPIGFLIDEEGILATSVAMGEEAILNLTVRHESQATARP